MQAVKRRLQIFLALFLVVTATGTFGFMALENLSFADALYYNIVTMSTVGYGDIHPTKQISRLLAIFLIIMGGASFLGVIANVTEMVLLKREVQSRMRKVNMVLGVFFSEVGFRLLHIFSSYNQTIEKIRANLLVRSSWSEANFLSAQKVVKRHNLRVDIGRVDLEDLHTFLDSKRRFLVSLLENPVLIEHEGCSEALLAVFHLADELCCRDGLNNLPELDRNHLAVDIDRAYQSLADQWLVYLRHLKSQYPYLFSLAVRKNPFDPQASPIVLE